MNEGLGSLNIFISILLLKSGLYFGQNNKQKMDKYDVIYCVLQSTEALEITFPLTPIFNFLFTYVNCSSTLCRKMNP